MEMQRKSRKLRPHIIPEFDNPVVIVRCDPLLDDIKVDELVQEALVRFEFVLGTFFRFLLIDIGNEDVLAYREYLVSSVKETMRTDQVNYAQTLTRNIATRKATVVNDWVVLHESAEQFRPKKVRQKLGEIKPKKAKSEDPSAVSKEELLTLNPAKLQQRMKQITGSGFPPGTDKGAMVAGILEALSNKAD